MKKNDSLFWTIYIIVALILNVTYALEFEVNMFAVALVNILVLGFSYFVYWANTESL